jgi:hypothetical protein
MSEAAKGIRFIYFTLCHVGIEVELPIKVTTDNAGAMFMIQNSSTGVQSWHFYVRYHVVCKNVEDGIVKVEFVNSNENDSDMFTKYASKEAYEWHAVKFLGSIEDFRSEERFGLGRVLEISLSFNQKLVFICLGYQLGIFIIDEMCESANQCISN